MHKPQMHFHRQSMSRDCDGGHGSDSVATEYAGLTDRLAWSAIVAHVIRFSELHPRIERWTDEEGDWHIEYGGPTDEGYRVVEEWTCKANGCVDEPRYVWDEYAEAAGY